MRSLIKTSLGPVQTGPDHPGWSGPVTDINQDVPVWSCLQDLTGPTIRNPGRVIGNARVQKLRLIRLGRNTGQLVSYPQHATGSAKNTHVSLEEPVDNIKKYLDIWETCYNFDRLVFRKHKGRHEITKARIVLRNSPFDPPRRFVIFPSCIGTITFIPRWSTMSMKQIIIRKYNILSLLGQRYRKNMV